MIYLEKIENGALVGWVECTERSEVKIEIYLEEYKLGALQLSLDLKNTRFSFDLDAKLLYAIAYRYRIKTFRFGAALSTTQKVSLVVRRQDVLHSIDPKDLCQEKDFLYLIPLLPEIESIGYRFSQENITNLLHWSLKYKMQKYFPQSCAWLLSESINYSKEFLWIDKDVWKGLRYDRSFLEWLWKNGYIKKEGGYRKIFNWIRNQRLLDRYIEELAKRTPLRVAKHSVKNFNQKFFQLEKELGIVQYRKGVALLASASWVELYHWLGTLEIFPKNPEKIKEKLFSYFENEETVVMQWMLCWIFWAEFLDFIFKREIAQWILKKKAFLSPLPQEGLVKKIWDYSYQELPIIKENFYILYKIYLKAGTHYSSNISTIVYAYMKYLYFRGVPSFLEEYLFFMKDYFFNENTLLDFLTYSSSAPSDRVKELYYLEALRKKAIKMKKETPLATERFSLLQEMEEAFPSIAQEEGFSLVMNLWNQSNKKKDRKALWPYLVKYAGEYERYRCAFEVGRREEHNFLEVLLTTPTKFRNSETQTLRSWLLEILYSRRKNLQNRILFFQSLWMEIKYRKREGRSLSVLLSAFPGELLLIMELGLDPYELLGIDREKFYQHEIFSLDTVVIYRLSLLKEWERVRFSDLPKDVEYRLWIRQKLIFPHTMVLIYSCQAYRASRQKSIRESWLHRLIDFGIDFRFIEGGAEEFQDDGETLALEVEDSYEALPQKSLLMFHKVHRIFGHDFFLKVDDDCLLNVDAYFSDPNLLSSDYYGRILGRDLGDLDRIWHHKKVHSPSQQESIDLSPEPSRYADGGSAYFLSRHACEALEEAWNYPKTLALQISSFIEDKLVGDLLLTQGISPSFNEDSTLIHRRVAPNMQATFWEYGLFPSPDNMVKCYHTELEEEKRKVWGKWEKSHLNWNFPFYLSNQAIHSFKKPLHNSRAMIEIIHQGSKIVDAKKIVIYQSSCWKKSMIHQAKNRKKEDEHSFFLIEIEEKSLEEMEDILEKDLYDEESSTYAVRVLYPKSQSISSFSILHTHYGLSKKLYSMYWNQDKLLWEFDKLLHFS